MRKSLSFPKVFFGVFFHPRETTRLVLKKKYYSFIIPFIFTYCIINVFDPVNDFELSKFIPWFMAPLAVALFSIIVGFGFFFLESWLTQIIGKKIGGKGDFRKIQAAYALSFTPAFFGVSVKLFAQLPIWVKIAADQKTGFAIISDDLLAMNQMPLIYESIFLLWSMAALIVNVSEAHQFSKWKSGMIQLAIFGIFLFVFVVGVLSIKLFF